MTNNFYIWKDSIRKCWFLVDKKTGIPLPEEYKTRKEARLSRKEKNELAHFRTHAKLTLGDWLRHTEKLPHPLNKETISEYGNLWYRHCKTCGATLVRKLEGKASA